MRPLFAALLFAGIVTAQPMPSPLPQIQAPQSESIFDMARRMQQIRQIQLQNQQIRLENVRLQQDIEQRANEARQASAGQRPLYEYPQQSAAPKPSISTADMVTGGLLNCRAWTVADETNQLTYVAGLNEASVMLLAEFGKVADVQRVVPVGTNNAEARTAIASFCASPENRPVPVAFIYRVVAAKANGALPDAIERQLAAYRKIAADALQSEAK